MLEGVAVYLERGVLERALRQFRQAAGPDSRLAISMSIDSDAHDPEVAVQVPGSCGRNRRACPADPRTRRGGRAPCEHRVAGARRGSRRRAAPLDEDGDEDSDEDSDEAAQQRRRSVGLLLAKVMPAQGLVLEGALSDHCKCRGFRAVRHPDRVLRHGLGPAGSGHCKLPEETVAETRERVCWRAPGATETVPPPEVQLVIDAVVGQLAGKEL